MSRKLLVIGAHSADFVWRAGGAIAVATSNGGAAGVLALSEQRLAGELQERPSELRSGRRRRGGLRDFVGGSAHESILDS